MIGVLGGGLTLFQITGGEVPSWVGGLLISAVVLAYVTIGGLRGTAWVNTFQTIVFMVLGAVTLVYIVRQLGGFEAALAQVSAERPDLLVRAGQIPPAAFVGYILIPCSAGMFPHLFMHWLSARNLQAFKLPMIAYPLCVAIVWLPSTLLGVFAHGSFPDLHGPAASSVLIRMIHEYAPEFLAGLLRRRRLRGGHVVARLAGAVDRKYVHSRHRRPLRFSGPVERARPGARRSSLPWSASWR